MFLERGVCVSGERRDTPDSVSRESSQEGQSHYGHHDRSPKAHIFPTTIIHGKSLLRPATLRPNLTLSPPHQPKPKILLLLARHEDVRPVTPAVLAIRLPSMMRSDSRARTVPAAGEDHDRATTLCWNCRNRRVQSMTLSLLACHLDPRLT